MTISPDELESLLKAAWDEAWTVAFQQGRTAFLRRLKAAVSGLRIYEMSHEQAEACLGLLVALREAGYRMR